ncbi:hypothetical protein B0I35DRAFT_477023 [Stachybotrys elegans]|uniref:Uncharacterized protein n=1 Tax=Stachybotrys elegans TaxID=80388 RepID=A0A8K0SZT6_9HYPO|nr:hypothetical protein B0I35DRAFT_477023 [Stachybotrys elegans]
MVAPDAAPEDDGILGTEEDRMLDTDDEDIQGTDDESLAVQTEIRQAYEQMFAQTADSASASSGDEETESLFVLGTHERIHYRVHIDLPDPEGSVSRTGGWWKGEWSKFKLKHDIWISPEYIRKLPAKPAADSYFPVWVQECYFDLPLNLFIPGQKIYLRIEITRINRETGKYIRHPQAYASGARDDDPACGLAIRCRWYDVRGHLQSKYVIITPSLNTICRANSFVEVLTEGAGAEELQATPRRMYRLKGRPYFTADN